MSQDNKPKSVNGLPTNLFQRRLVEDKDTLWKIVKAMHPYIPDTFTNNKDKVCSMKDERLKAYMKYDWVNIEFRAKGYGMVSIGITNCEDTTNGCGLMGGDVTRQDMRDALESGNVKFRVWRFVDDHHSKREHFAQELSCKEIFEAANYTQPTVAEWYKFYYSD